MDRLGSMARQRLRRTLAVAGATALVAGSLGMPAATTAQEPVELTWVHLIFWDTSALIAKFEAENPDIRITAEALPFEDLVPQTGIRLAAGDGQPDIVSVDSPLTSSYGYRGELVPLEGIYTPEELDSFVPGTLAAGTYDGHLLSAPLNTSTQLLFVNRDLFEAAGVEPPGVDDRWTYEQIADAATKITNGDTYGFSWEQTEAIYQIGVLPGSLGAPMIGEDGLTVDGVINGPEWVKALQYYSDIYNALGVGPKGAGVSAMDAFMAGKLAMVVAGPWQIRSLAGADLPFEWSVSRHPYFEGGKVVTPTGSWHIGVNSTSANIEAAERFVHWLTTGEGAAEWYKIASYDFPAQRSVLEDIATDPQYDEAPMSYMRTAAEEAEMNPLPRAVTPGYMEYQQIMGETLADIRNGADVQESLDLAVERLTAEMDKYR